MNPEKASIHISTLVLGLDTKSELAAKDCICNLYIHLGTNEQI